MPRLRVSLAAVLVWSSTAAAAAQAPAEPTRDPGSDCASSATVTLGAPDARRLLAVAAGERGRDIRHLIARPSDRPDPPPCGADPASGAGDRASGPSGTGFTVHILPAYWRSVGNTRYPTDRNNGALWSARGVASIVGSGIAARWGPISAAVAPRGVFSRVAGDARTAPLFHLDRRQPAPTDPMWRVHPGQSFVRLDAFGLKAGVSTENLWWGPARRYPLLMSSTAPGFPHAFVGTSRPAPVGIGRLDAELVWGHLEASDGFYAEPSDGRALFAGAIAAFTPRGLDALSIGIARVYLSRIPPEGLTVGDYIRRPYTGITENPSGNVRLADNELLTLFVRWGFPAIGLDAYAEWAREDFWGGGQDLVLELDHSQAYTLGLEKRLSVADRPARLTAEAASLGSAKSRLSRRPGMRFYMHSALRQGYSHAGQLLGAWIGPGADAQFLALDVALDRGAIGAYLERVRRRAGDYYNRWGDRFDAAGHDLELIAGVRGSRPFGPVEISWDIALARRWNRDFLALRGGEVTAEENLNVEIGATWWPGDEAVLTR